VTEVCLRRRMEADDQLRLLAGLAGAEDYEPPGDRLADFLSDLGTDPDTERYAEIMAAAEAAGGEVS
jgi:hypothetical protein